ncbi:MAG: DUF2334 domain-containing protein [Lachnospiraceae bacterium]|nr:DUF2334 domain-containing protein [Lachnospiraceae bacterium]
MRKITIRIDDVTPGMNAGKMIRFAELLDRYDIKPLIGIIPENRDGSPEVVEDRCDEETQSSIDFKWIRERLEGGWIAAQHGCYHVYTTKSGGLFPLNSYSEFAGLSFEEQERLISHGKKVLGENGINTKIFMAPAHSYDKNTLKALRANGFEFVTDGFGSLPYNMGGLVFLPISFLRSRELKTDKDGITTFVVHTGMMEESDFEEYEGLLEKYRDRFVDYSEFLKIPPVRCSRGKHYGEYLMAKGKHTAAKIF